MTKGQPQVLKRFQRRLGHNPPFSPFVFFVPLWLYDDPRGIAMPKVTQVTAWIESRPGALGQVASAMGAKKVNLLAFHATMVGGRGAVRMVVDKPALAVKVCAQNGWQSTEDELVQISLRHKPGALGEAASKLGGAGINIDYAYAGPGRGAKVNLYLAVSDLAGALKALR